VVCGDKRAGVGRRRFDAGRHAAATLLLDEGVPLEVVSVVLGHASLAITTDVYARVTQDSKRRHLELLADTLDRPMKRRSRPKTNPAERLSGVCCPLGYPVGDLEPIPLGGR
jgi:hypothetical protein